MKTQVVKLELLILNRFTSDVFETQYYKTEVPPNGTTYEMTLSFPLESGNGWYCYCADTPEDIGRGARLLKARFADWILRKASDTLETLNKEIEILTNGN